MDVKIAFLNGDLEEEIYMEQPEGCVVPGKEKKVCKLVKSRYGLKQDPKQWHNKFDHVLVTNGYSINDVDKCIYNKYEDNTCVVIYLYVDDMLIFRTSLEVVCKTKKFLGSKFDMKDLRETEVILGIKITRTPNGLKLSQEHCVEKILRKFEHFDCKPVSTPYDQSSQPDIAYAAGRLSRYTQSPNQDHWTIVRRVLKYLKGTINYEVQFLGSLPSKLALLGLLWRLIYYLKKASSEAKWLRNLLVDIPLWTRLALSVSMRCDSQAAIAKAKSKIFNEKNRTYLWIHLYESGGRVASYENLGRFSELS
ncbi:Retrovirus-related Pol polyprotein from transposon TNT 1-94 [Vitis vinifera]|uniref:Retrovirus-related Pol polyprotein from transposon TNT 1-94 n=1 Tax=Vitis vinifera TaxID=29760 RepID=A0A438I5X7_VITVI|nr:Retrovirus-related Pol polyprotein from transposon TNT 1-94 [Vitis vinifera]